MYKSFFNPFLSVFSLKTRIKDYFFKVALLNLINEYTTYFVYILECSRFFLVKTLLCLSAFFSRILCCGMIATSFPLYMHFKDKISVKMTLLENIRSHAQLHYSVSYFAICDRHQKYIKLNFAYAF